MPHIMFRALYLIPAAFGVELRLHNDLNGRLVVNGTYGPLLAATQSTWMPLLLTADSQSLLVPGDSSPGSTANLGLSSFVPESPVLVQITSTHQPHLGVGPRSQLVSAYGSVSVLKNGGDLNLVIGANEVHNFTDTCVPESCATIQLNNDSIPFIGSIRGISDMLPEEPVYENEVSMSFHFFKEAVLFSIPSSIQDQIEHIIITNDIDLRFRNEDESYISGCTREIMDLFPTIELLIEGNHNSKVVLRFTGEDYLRFDPDSYSCYFKYVLSPDPETPILINPILFPNINVRFTQDAMELCDARDD